MRPQVLGLSQICWTDTLGPLPALDINGLLTSFPRLWSRPRPNPSLAPPPPSNPDALSASLDPAADAAMERYARGDDSAFGEVYDRIAPRVRAFLLRRTRDPATADDLLQQTMLQIHRHRGTYLAGAAVLPWAFAIARRLSIDEFRHKRHTALVSVENVADSDASDGSTPDEELLGREAARLIHAELSRIPETQRAAFELLRIEGLSQEEAARVLGTTVSAVKLRAFRAYAAIRAVLAGRDAKPNFGEQPTQ
jgi:RNA polymerase sigma-70 factor (ECF subfamily)